MLNKNIEYQVDSKTFPSQQIPRNLRVPSPISVDLGLALLMLGSVTVPGGFTSASPAGFWAWVRYLSAISTSRWLRITGPFADLDPHQKSILSDDFGVAIATTWFANAVG